EPVVGAALQGHLKDLSLRSLERRFLQTAGVTQSTVRQIERARSATLLLQQGVSILDTIEEAGYFDQPHLTRSLKYFIGQTPAQILGKSRPEQLPFLYKTAPFFGYCVGAGIAMEIAIEHPSIVRKLVLATPIYTADGFHPGVLAGMEALQPAHLAGSPFEEEYGRCAPNTRDWPTLIAKMKQLNREFVDWPPEAIASIKAPTLLIAGDSDIVRPEHVVEIFRLLGGGIPGDNVGLPKSRLAVLPGTTHITLVDRADWLVPMITEFLDV
ncbi:MAG: helix-turn-helix domain-containing protein, partial [Chloroflexota bacterium]